jgi:adenosine kinase
MKIIINGSLAYDRIMDFSGYFSDHILPEKIKLLNVSFQVNGMKEKFGGAAGNIAYALTLLGEHPDIWSTIGKDYQRYFAWLQQQGISTKGIKIIEDEFTAGAYITTDKSNNQITAFNMGAMKYNSTPDFDSLASGDSLVIISPGNPDDMRNFPRMCKERGIDYIFDPGQQLPMLSAQDLVQAVSGCFLLICNDYEIEMIMSKTGLTKSGLLGLTRNIIVTQGERGSTIWSADGDTNIPVIKPDTVIDPTGAGDAYRGGLISGLARKLSLEQSARMGSVCSSFCLECLGTQEYRFSIEQFQKRSGGKNKK